MAGEAVVPLHRVYHIDDIRQAHAEIEEGPPLARSSASQSPARCQSIGKRQRFNNRGGVMTTYKPGGFPVCVVGYFVGGLS